jgi:SAM-dependent methyltransferase
MKNIVEFFKVIQNLMQFKLLKWLSFRLRANSAVNTNQFSDAYTIMGRCNICGKKSTFYYYDKKLYRESLVCKYCLSTSRYRSIARGILKEINLITNKKIESLDTLSKFKIPNKINLYDTQPSFKYLKCAYPIPEILSKNHLIKINVSTFNKKGILGERLNFINERIVFSNQNLEKLTFNSSSFDIVITSDVMEHVRLDKLAHREIYRILKYGGIYLFTVPHDMKYEENLERVKIIDEDDISKDQFVLKPEYHGDVNSEEGCGALSYRVYGKNLIYELENLGFSVEYTSVDFEENAILNTELFICRKIRY